MNKVITTPQELKNHVKSEYAKYDTELNSLFFDIQVKMPQYDILQAYACIQKEINGDEVIRLSDPAINAENTELPTIQTIRGTKEQLIPENCYTDIYEGNCKDFLESFNDQELETGLCRIMDITEKEGVIDGIKLDFIN